MPSKQVRAYCFTLNLPDGTEYFTEEQLTERVTGLAAEPGFRYLCFQREVAPTTLKLHYQGYVHFGYKATLIKARAFVRSLFGSDAHFEPARGTGRDNRAYCSKEPGTCFQEFGKLPEQGGRSDLAALAADVISGMEMDGVAEKYPSDYIRYARGIQQFQSVVRCKPRSMDVVPTVLWWFGPTGVGKSRKAFEIYGKEAYVKMNNQWWDMYQGQRVVIMDDYRPNMCPFSDLLRILDRYPLRVQVKGSSMDLSATFFVITTTSRPEVLWGGRTPENIRQLIRRITEIIQFKEDGTEEVLKNNETDYIIDYEAMTTLHVPNHHIV